MSRTRDLWQEVVDLYQAAVLRQRRKDGEGARRALAVAFERCLHSEVQRADGLGSSQGQAAVDPLTTATICLASGRAELEAGAAQTARERLWTGIGLFRADSPSPLLTQLRLAYLEALLVSDGCLSTEERERAQAQVWALAEDRGRLALEEGLLRARTGLLLAQLPGIFALPVGVLVDSELHLAREKANETGAVGLEAAAQRLLMRRALARGSVPEARHWQREQQAALESIEDQEGLGWMKLEKARQRLEQGRAWAARRLCQQARRQLGQAGSTAGEEQARTLLLTIPMWLVVLLMITGGRKRLKAGNQG